MKEAGPGPYFPQIEAYKTLFSTQSTHIWTAISQQRGGTLDVDDPSLIVKFSNRQNSCYKSVGFCSSKKKKNGKIAVILLIMLKRGRLLGNCRTRGERVGTRSLWSPCWRGWTSCSLPFSSCRVFQMLKQSFFRRWITIMHSGNDQEFFLKKKRETEDLFFYDYNTFNINTFRVRFDDGEFEQHSRKG